MDVSHPDPAADWVGGDDVYRGHDGVRSYMAQAYEAFELLQIRNPLLVGPLWRIPFGSRLTGRGTPTHCEQRGTGSAKRILRCALELSPDASPALEVA